jgi:hypothetical protein
VVNYISEELIDFFRILLWVMSPTTTIDTCKPATSFFGNTPHRMSKITQRFGKHCSFHLQDEYVMLGHSWKSYIGETVGEEFDLMVLIDAAVELALYTASTNA